VRYTAEAARDLLTRDEASVAFAQHAVAEGRANLQFSARQCRAFATRFRGRTQESHRRLYGLCAVLMEQAAARA
jgi:hypothetical protein